jgi:hypothetical protein
MTFKGLRITLATGIVALTAAVAVPLAARATDSSDVNSARNGTVAFHNLDAASAAGYGLFKDAQGIACIDKPGSGGMGVHYVNGTLIQKMVIDPARPEALVYEPQQDGRLHLVAVEYIVFAQAWYDAGHTTAPRLFGHDFLLVPEGNRYGIPPFWELHAWVWKNNPRGMFENWNPKVNCSRS